MIFYGASGAKSPVQIDLPEEHCPNCNEQGGLTANAYSRYAYLYWIPMFTLGKKGFAHCDHCGTEFKGNKMTAPLKDAVEAAKTHVKIPIWHFIGLAVVAVLIVAAFMISGDHEEEQAEYFANPMAGDVYKVDGEELDNEDYYSLVRITAIQEDSVLFQANEYQSNKLYNLYEINNDTSYGDVLIIDKPTFFSLYNEETTYGVIREAEE